MKKLIKNLFNTFLIVSSLALVSCNNIMHNDEEQKSLTKITLTATVDLGDTSRKAVPEDYSLYDNLTYKLKATCNTDNSYSIEPFFGTPEIELELIAANWSFELTAYDAGNTPIFRSSENVNIDIAEDTVLNFKMVGVANGVLEYEFNLGSIAGDETEPSINPNLKYIVYKYSKPLLEENKIALTDENFQNSLSREVTEENGKNITSFTKKVTISLPEGTYLVICEKESEANPEEFNFFFQELVEIKAGLTTTSGYNDISSTSPEYKITFHTNGGRFEDGPEPIIPNESYYYKYSVESGKITYNAAFPTPVRQDCVFAGWYYDSAFTNPVTYDFAYRFDLPDTEANNVYFLGNCDVYAEWKMVTFPQILLYESNSSKKPVVTNNWSLTLETNGNDVNNYYYRHAINVGNDVYGIYQYYNNEYKSVVLKNSEIMINAEKFLEKEPKKIAYDSVTNKIVILLTSNQDGTNEYSFMTCNPDGTEPTSIEYSTEYKNILLKEKLSSEVEPYAFAVHNNIVYFSFYQFNAYASEQQYSKLYVSNIGGSEASLRIQDISDFIGSSLDGMKDFIQSAQISDIVFASDDAIYASVIVGSDEMILDNLVHFGLIVKVDPSEYTATPLFNYNPLNKKILTLPNYGNDNDIQANYYGINGLGDKSCLAGPTRILAIKEDELVLVDEGVYMWTSKINKAYYNDVNRIVVFDLAENSIKYLYNISSKTSNFEYTPGSLPGGFSSISVNLIGKDS